jgi:glycosyltransferase involved in cell wall biosynthesis
MALFIAFSLMIPALLLAILVTVFLVEVMSAVVLPQREFPVPLTAGSRPSIGVLVPAHNESIGLLATLEDIKAQLGPADRLLVVADNCTDDTAIVAKLAGAEIVERNDPDRKGKGYALACGLRILDADPRDIVMIFDADCRLGDATIDRLAAMCTATHRPIQALDLMIASKESPINLRVAEFAWRVKNWVRPLGLRALGLPCQLMGTGMAFPWDIIHSANLASGSIVEDLKLGHDLALAGISPLFCPSAAVTSVFASSLEGAQSQRLRWESGHVGTILTAAPRLIVTAIARMNWNLLALAIDVTVPPLSLLAIFVIGVSLIAGLAASLGFSSKPLWVSSASLAGLAVAVILCWIKYGRDILSPSAILSIAYYVIGKLPVYSQILTFKSRSQWIRTDRKKSGQSEPTQKREPT